MRVYERRSRRLGKSAAPTESTTTDAPKSNPDNATRPGNALVWVPCTRPPAPQDTRSQLDRRHSAADRSAPLGCGCRDPLLCSCYETEPPLSDHALDGWRDAVLKVLFNRQVPLLPIEVRRALWKRGGPDRILAERLHEACSGEVA